MIFDLKLPAINEHMTEALIECVYASQGTVLRPGDRLLDLSVDLGASFSQDCPPISFFRIVAREKAVVREVSVTAGVPCKVGDLMMRFSTAIDESLDHSVERGVRIVTAGIVHHSGLWTGNRRT